MQKSEAIYIAIKRLGHSFLGLYKQPICWAGVLIALLGLWLEIPWLYLIGFALSLPLLVIVLPVCCIALTVSVTRPVWYPVYWGILQSRGAPFHEGDIVEILRGPQKGRTLTIYDVWNERELVRVHIGEKEKNDLTDLFSFLIY